MKKRIIIIGNNQTAELATWYLKNDTDFEICGYAVDEKYITSNTFNDMPLVSYNNIENLYPKEEFQLFAPMQAKNMNEVRRDIFLRGKKKGYNFISYKSSKATILTKEIGENCFILEDNTIQPYTSIGSNVVIWSGNHIGHHSIIEDHVFITSHVVVSGRCVIQQHAFLGVNCCIKDGITIGQKCLIGMGAVITNSTENDSVYTCLAATKQKAHASRLRF